jgi:hypothetical protein
MRHHPDCKSATIDVSFTITTHYGGYGELRYGEGKHGGAEQTIVTRRTGERRVLSSIPRNVFDAWMTYSSSRCHPSASTRVQTQLIQ